MVTCIPDMDFRGVNLRISRFFSRALHETLSLTVGLPNFRTAVRSRSKNTTTADSRKRWALGFWVLGFGFGVLSFGVWGLGFGVSWFRFRISGSGFGFRVSGFGLRLQS